MRTSPTTAVRIAKVARAAGRLSVQVALTDVATGASKGVFEASWEEATELPEFIEQNSTVHVWDNRASLSYS